MTDINNFLREEMPNLVCGHAVTLIGAFGVTMA